MPRPASLQHLAPQWARLCLDVETQLNHLCPNLLGSSLLIACSGGIDSTALLHILFYLSPKNNFTLHAVHLDHGLRPSSAQDMIFVEKMSSELDITFHGKRMEVGSLAEELSLGIEESGRIARYDFFEHVRISTQSSQLLLGHHQGDMMEDMLLRIMRGTSWPALAGMVANDPDRRILRPLLYIPKQKLRTFLEDNHICWCEDESNNDDSYTRNRVRHDILPKVLNENPGFGKTSIRLHKQAVLDRDYFNLILEAIPRTMSKGRISIHCNRLLDIHPAIRIRLYKQILDSLGPGQVLTDTLFDLDRAVSASPLPHLARFQFPGNKTVNLSGQQLVFVASKSNE